MFKKEYVSLYLSRFCYSFANAIIDVYGTVLLYNNNISVAQIFIIYALRFGLMGVSTPLSIIFSTKIGIGATALIANVIRAAFAYVILFDATSNIPLLILLLALPGAISNPLATILSARHVEPSCRGKYNSLRIICKILGTALASLTILYGISSNKQSVLFIIVMGFFILDSIFTFMVSFKPIKPKNNAFKETLSYIMKTPDSLKTLYSLRTFHIAERIFIPLYLYLALQDFVLFSTVISLSLIIQTILMLFCGHLTDKNILKMNKFISILRVILTSAFIFFRDKIVISINKTAFDNMEQIYDMVYISSVENIIKKSPIDHSVLASSGEMCLCFSELIFFSIFALIAHYDITAAFIFMFAGSIISTVIMNKKIKERLQK